MKYVYKKSVPKKLGSQYMFIERPPFIKYLFICVGDKSILTIFRIALWIEKFSYDFLGCSGNFLNVFLKVHTLTLLQYHYLLKMC